MKRLSEGKKMFWSVMMFFITFAVVFIIFDDFDRSIRTPLNEHTDWNLLLFAIVLMLALSVMLYRYSRRMDERISNEQAEKQAKLRRELTQNISHELKTPVASIQGYCETLLEHPDLDPDLARQFISRTHRQAVRLSSLLHDLSLINSMEQSARLRPMERVAVALIVRDIVAETAHRAQENGITVNNCLPQDIVVTGDETLLYSVFRNLLDNAINYAGKDATIELSADNEGDNRQLYEFTVSDNGLGIGEEHLPHIFDRFYRVDKGRSRMLGGNGLGLAIVKNAVLVHGGTITAQAIEPHGVAFTFTLRK